MKGKNRLIDADSMIAFSKRWIFVNADFRRQSTSIRLAQAEHSLNVGSVTRHQKTGALNPLIDALEDLQMPQALQAAEGIP